MLTTGNRMLALKFWQRKFALLFTALLLVVPASAQDPVDPDEEAAAEETDEPTEPTDAESDAEEADDSDFGELPMMDRDEMLFQAGDIEEILITGEKQNTLQDAPTSSTSFSAGELQALRIEDIADLADYTPNLEINTAFAASNPTIFIRGIGLKDYNANAAGAVAVYQDGVNINSPAIQLGQLFDIDGIDVLRGPQGSVNGRNATAGAILIRSAMPDGEFGVSTSLTYGNYDDKEVEAAINVPLIEDVLSMRVSGTAQWRDGYTKNQCAGWNPEALGFRRVDAASNLELYEMLQPAGQWENGEIREVKITNERGKELDDAFIYLNYELAADAVNYANGIKPGTSNNAFLLDEDLFDANGVKIASKNDKVAIQSLPFISIDDVDDICIVNAPGVLINGQGEFDNFGNPNFIEGTWQPSRTQPGLEEYADLERWTNNIDNWAARMVLVFVPLDNMEWMFNIHGTQNRGDSAHLQMLGADAKRGEILGFNEFHEHGFSENSAALASEAKLNVFNRLGEGVRDVPGIDNIGLPSQGGGNPFSGFYDADGTEFIDAWGVNGRGSWDLEAVVLTLYYDYEWYDRVVEDEGDANPLRVFPAIWSDSAWQTTEELRVEGEEDRYKWTVGFFFLYEELDAENFFPDTLQFQTDQKFSQTLLSWAPYVNAEVDLVEPDQIPGIFELKLSAGARYNQERKKFSLTSSAVGTTSGEEVIELPEDTSERTWKEWTGDVNLSYTPFSNEFGTLLSYLKYGHGFKGGHFNAGLTITGGDPEQNIEPVEPEFIDAVEFGIRTRWLDDRLTLNAAVFRYWYQDLQVFDISNESGKLPIQKLLNGDADVLGAEVELRVEPLPGLLVSANMGWLDGEFSDFTVTKTVPQKRGSPQPQDFDYAGNRLVAAPEWNFSMIAEYEVPLFGWGSLVPQWDFNYRSKTYLDPQMVDPISQDAYWLHNARIAYRTPDERIELAFWVSNIFEKEYKIDVFDITRESNTILEVWGEPRTYGVTLSLNW
jgi:outer membrane receptor protein involved in Fe transport